MTCKTEIISTAEYMNTKYREERFVNIIQSHASNQQNIHSTIQTAAKVADELNNQMKTVTYKREAFNT